MFSLGRIARISWPFLTVFSFWLLPWEEEGAEIVLGTVAIPTEAYRRKNSAEKASSARSLSQWNQISTDPLVNANSVLTVTQDHRHLGQIDPNVPVFLENVVFFEAGRRRVLGNGSACTRRLLPTSPEPRRRTILWLSTAFMKYLPEIWSVHFLALKGGYRNLFILLLVLSGITYGRTNRWTGSSGSKIGPKLQN